MVKVICAVLRYTEQQTTSIIEHEKLRQSVGYFDRLNFSRVSSCDLALVKFNEIIIASVINGFSWQFLFLFFYGIRYIYIYL